MVPHKTLFYRQFNPDSNLYDPPLPAEHIRIPLYGSNTHSPTPHRPGFYFLVLSNLGSINIGCVPETEEVYPFQCRYLYGSTTPTARGFTSQFYQIWEVVILVVFP